MKIVHKGKFENLFLTVKIRQKNEIYLENSFKIQDIEVQILAGKKHERLFSSKRHQS